MLVGGIATAFWMINFAGKLPLPVLFLLMILSALIAGGLWGFLPGFFKAKWNTNETLFTLMMNYIAIQFTSYCVARWENPPGSNSVGVINRAGAVKNVGWIGNMFSKGYNADYGWVAVIVLLLAAVIYIYLNYTKQGYEIAVVGDTENTARAGPRHRGHGAQRPPPQRRPRAVHPGGGAADRGPVRVRHLQQKSTESVL